MKQIEDGKETEFEIKGNRSLYYKDRVCVPNDCEIRKVILDEAHSESFAIHPGSTKMYQDLKMSFWWSGMKKDICYEIGEKVFLKVLPWNKGNEIREKGQVKPQIYWPI